MNQKSSKYWYAVMHILFIRACKIVSSKTVLNFPSTASNDCEVNIATITYWIFLKSQKQAKLQVIRNEKLSWKKPTVNC